MTGMRLGYLAAPAEVVQKMLPLHRTTVVCAPVISQYGGIAALRESRDWFTPLLTRYTRRRQAWMHTLDACGLAYIRSEGSYYLFIDIRVTGLSSRQFVERAEREAGLVFVEGSTYGAMGEGFIRASLAQQRFEEGLERFKVFAEHVMA